MGRTGDHTDRRTGHVTKRQQGRQGRRARHLEMDRTDMASRARQWKEQNVH